MTSSPAGITPRAITAVLTLAGLALAFITGCGNDPGISEPQSGTRTQTASASVGVLSEEGDSEVRMGLSMSPVPLNLRGLNQALVGRGSYLVNAVAECTRCHTVGSRYLAGGNPFAGEQPLINAVNFLGGNRSIGGGLSRNLTPDAAGLPGGLTLEQFILTMRSGIDLKGLAPFTPSATLDLLQGSMPWPENGKMSTKDLRAMYEYLKAIPCVPGGPGLSATRCAS